MRRKTLSYLEEFIVKGLYDGFVNKPFITLFKNYMDKEFRNVNDFVCVASAYVKFIMVNKSIILENYPDLDEKVLDSDLNEITRIINHLKGRENIHTLNNYIRMVEYFINRNTRVLDVGAGAFPLSSIKLTRASRNVTAMDEFIVSDNLIKSKNVNPLNQYFDYNTDVSNYDFVVGLKPCSAIGKIVEVCKNENKPYFIHLCNCSALDFALTRFNSFAGDWKQILPEIDSSVKFVNVFATNIDMSEDKLKKVVYRKCRLTKEMQSCGMLEFMQSFNNVMMTLSESEMRDGKTIYTPQGEVVVSRFDAKNEWKHSDDERVREKE